MEGSPQLVEAGDDSGLHVVRVTAWAGIAIGSLFLLSLVIGSPGDVPGADDSAKEVAEHYTENRGSTMTASLLYGMAWCGVFLVFVTGLQTLVRERDGISELWATVGFVAGIAASAVVAVNVALTTVAAFRTMQPDVVLGVHEGVLLSNAAVGYAAATCLVGFTVAITRSEHFPLWVTTLGLATAGTELFAAMSVASEGAFSPSGFFGFVAPALFAAWVAAIGVVLLRVASAQPPPAPAERPPRSVVRHADDWTPPRRSS